MYNFPIFIVMERNKKGVIGFVLLSLLLGYIVYPFMVYREEYQKEKYPYNEFEWDDIKRYGITIVVGGTLHIIICALLHLQWWMYI